MDDGRETNQEDDNYSLSELKNSCFNLMFKIEDGFVQDEENYEKAIKAFIKQEKKLSTNTAIQKALHTFAKDVVTAVKKGKRKNSGNIPVQNTAKSRRLFKHRGGGPSQQGRPTNEQSVHNQLVVREQEDFVAHSIPRKPRKKKYPHSLATAVDSNRPGEKKH